ASIIPRTAAGLRAAFDEENGGLQRAPKFPSNLPVRLLLRANRRGGDVEALRMATATLAKMAAGGIHDQIGGGFHRYATGAARLAGARPTGASRRLFGRFVADYDVTAGGNFEGRNILHVPQHDEAEAAALAGARATLYAARARREPPARDEKILAAWNGLMISALAQ